MPKKSINQVGRFYHMNNVEVPHRRDRRKKSPGVSASIAIFAGDQIRRERRIKSPGVSPASVSTLLAPLTYDRNLTLRHLLEVPSK